MTATIGLSVFVFIFVTVYASFPTIRIPSLIIYTVINV